MPASQICHFALSLFLCVAVATLTCIFSASQILAASNISLGSKLIPGDTTGWVSSPNQSFHLTFYNPSNSDSFSVGILYYTAGINSTIVWTPGVEVGSSGSFELSSDGNLLLKNDTSTTVWNSSTANRKVEGASMGDDGNFFLFNSSDSNIWQSFDTPTDTIVLNQKLRQGMQLISGEYTATMLTTGNLSLTYNSNGGYTYWSSDTSSGDYAVLDSRGILSVINEKGLTLGSWYSNDYTSTSTPAPTRRLTLDSDGNLRIYTWSAGSSTSGWTVGWEALEDLCQIYAYCGPNGLCSYSQTAIICTCATQAGYDFTDKGNPRSGCKVIAGQGGQNCTGGSATMVELNNTMLFISFSGTANTNFRYGDAQCLQRCLNNDQCTAATPLSDGSGTCQNVLAGTFFSGYQQLSISTNSYFKYCGSNVPPAGSSSNGELLGPVPSPGDNKSATTVPVVASVLVTLAIIALVQGGIWWICCRKNPRWGGYSAHYALMEYASGAPVQLTYKELRRATGNFKEKLGEGGFGAVYKGELETTSDGGERGAGTTVVAVKRLEGLADQGEKQFRMEVAVIGSTHHMNLVRLCGFCAEGKHRLLVYEYMRNGSLDKYLFEGEEPAGVAADIGDSAIDGGYAGRRDMDWETRFSVLLGTARGITYLHQECRDCIIHSDIKPENILLDDTFTARVSDFGLAKLTRAHHHPSGRHVTTFVRGTRGYLAPEWRSNLPITVKADVYSFGMVVLETISGRKSFESTSAADTSSTPRRHVSFPEWAYRQFFHHNQVEGVVDERIRGTVDMDQLERAMKVAFWCAQVQPSMRPSMGRVIQMLDGSMQEIQIPPMPKSFGDHINATNEEEDSNYVVRAFEQESSAPASTITLSTSFAKNSSFTTTTSRSSPSGTPKYSLSQSLISHQIRPPPPQRDNVPYSF